MIAALALLPASAGNAGDGQAADPLEAARKALHRGNYPFLDVDFSVSQVLPPTWWVITFYDEAGGDRLVARRTASTRAEPQVSWAASTTCPALLQRLNLLPRVTMRFNLPSDLGPKPALPPVPLPLHGTYVSVNGEGGSMGGGRLNLHAMTNHGALADWASKTEKALAPCWTEQEPAA